MNRLTKNMISGNYLLNWYLYNYVPHYLFKILQCLIIVMINLIGLILNNNNVILNKSFSLNFLRCLERDTQYMGLIKIWSTIYEQAMLGVSLKVISATRLSDKIIDIVQSINKLNWHWASEIKEATSVVGYRHCSAYP